MLSFILRKNNSSYIVYFQSICCTRENKIVNLFFSQKLPWLEGITYLNTDHLVFGTPSTPTAVDWLMFQPMKYSVVITTLSPDYSALDTHGSDHARRQTRPSFLISYVAVTLTLNLMAFGWNGFKGVAQLQECLVYKRGRGVLEKSAITSSLFLISQAFKKGFFAISYMYCGFCFRLYSSTQGFFF